MIGQEGAPTTASPPYSQRGVIAPPPPNLDASEPVLYNQWGNDTPSSALMKVISVPRELSQYAICRSPASQKKGKEE